MLRRSESRILIFFLVVAYTATATDKAGRSIPAPGRGVVGTAREIASKYPSRILDISYRKRQLEFRRTQISQWLQNETELLKEEVDPSTSDDYFSSRLAAIEGEAKRQELEALGTFGMLNGADPTIAPLRRALAVWGLTIDDVGVASVRFNFFLVFRLLTRFSSVPWNFYCRQRQERIECLQRTIPTSWSNDWKRLSSNFSKILDWSSKGRSCCLDVEWYRSIDSIWTRTRKSKRRQHRTRIESFRIPRLSI